MSERKWSAEEYETIIRQMDEKLQATRAALQKAEKALAEAVVIATRAIRRNSTPEQKDWSVNRLKSLMTNPGSAQLLAQVEEVARELLAALGIYHGNDCLWCNRYNNDTKTPCKAITAIQRATALQYDPPAVPNAD